MGKDREGIFYAERESWTKKSIYKQRNWSAQSNETVLIIRIYVCYVEKDGWISRQRGSKRGVTTKAFR